MDEQPNWCPNCERETDWVIDPSQLNIVRCKECGHLKKMPGVKVKRTSAKIRPNSKSIVTAGLALQVALQCVFGGLVAGGIWLISAYFFIQQGDLIFASLFFILFGITASTIGIYCILSEAEKIVEKKIKQR